MKFPIFLGSTSLNITIQAKKDPTEYDNQKATISNKVDYSNFAHHISLKFSSVFWTTNHENLT